MNRPIVAIPATASTVSTPIAVQASGAHPAQRAPARRVRIAAMTTPLITAGIAISISAHAPWAWTSVACRASPRSPDISLVE